VFSPATIETIGSYVYALTDASDRVFYVGKGQGNRVFQHIDEVRRLMDNDPNGLLGKPEADDEQDSAMGPKRQRIAQLLREGTPPRMYIVREGLTTEQALLIEASLISVLDWQLDGVLTNQAAGQGTTAFGLKTVEELEATKGEPFKLTVLPGLNESEEVIAINVNRRWDEVVTSKSTLLDISRGHWKLSKSRADRCRYAIIHANGIVRGVFGIRGWDGPDSQGRFTFRPVSDLPLQGAAFSQKNASSLFGVAGVGSQNPIRYVRLPR